MRVSVFDFAGRSVGLALRMTLWVLPAMLLMTVLMQQVTPYYASAFRTGFLSGGAPLIFLIFLIVGILFSGLAGSFIASIGFSVYHRRSPLQMDLLRHVLKRSLSVSMIIVWALLFLIPVWLMVLFLFQILLQVLPILAMLLFIPGQLMCFVALALCVDTERTALQSLSLAWQFVTTNFWWFIGVALLLVLVPLLVQMLLGVMGFANGMSEGTYYFLYLPLTAFTYSISVAAGILAVCEGDWSRTAMRANPDPAA